MMTSVVPHRGTGGVIVCNFGSGLSAHQKGDLLRVGEVVETATSDTGSSPVAVAGATAFAAFSRVWLRILSLKYGDRRYDESGRCRRGIQELV